MLKLRDMINTLLTTNERIEIRDEDGNELVTAPQNSDGLEPYLDKKVVKWFPHGAPYKDATFTVCVSEVSDEDLSDNSIQE